MKRMMKLRGGSSVTGIQYDAGLRKHLSSMFSGMSGSFVLPTGRIDHAH